MKNPQEDDAVERMLNQLEGLLKRQHDTARASRNGLIPLEEQIGAPADGGSNGSGSGHGKAEIELEEFDPDATAPDLNSYGQEPVELGGRKKSPSYPEPDLAAASVSDDAAHTAHARPDRGEPTQVDPERQSRDRPRNDTERDHGDRAASETPATVDDQDHRTAAVVTEPGRGAQPAVMGSDESKERQPLADVPLPDPPPSATVSPSEPLIDEPSEPSDAAHMTRRLTTRLGQLLLDSHLLSEAQLEKALEMQRESGERLGSILVTGGYIDETALLSVLSKQHGVPTANLDDIVVDPALTQMIPADMARRYQLVPMAIGKNAVDVAMVDPTDFVAMAHVRFATGLRPNVFITTTTAAERAMARLYAGTDDRPAEAQERPRDPRAEIKKMILDRDALLIAADQDPRKFYELAASIDAFVDEIIRKASGQV